MKNTFKAVLSVVLFLIPAFSLFSQTTGPRVPQTVQDEYVNKSGLVYSKKTQGPNSAGEYTIFLKTFVTGTVTTDQISIPSDIVLVLDVSGSMAWRVGANQDPGYGQNSRLDELKTAVNQFIDQITTDATENNVDNQIAIVKFAQDTYRPSDQNSLEESNEQDRQGRHYTSIVKKFYPVATNASTLKSAVTGIIESDNGCTAADYGMTKAEVLINDLISKNPNRISNKIVVLFTDGDPTYGSSFSSTVANNTITVAKRLKALTAYNDQASGRSAKVKVYTIGLFVNPSDNTENYMQRVSSNYPEASNINSSGGNNNGGYYFKVADAAGLQNAFETIGNDSASASIDLGSSATAVDVVSQSFDIPYVVDDEGNISTDVKVWIAPLSNITKDSQNKDVYTFPTTNLQPANGVTLEVNPQDGTVSVTGFDYTQNACAMVNGRPIGNQLIIEIPIKMDENAVGGHGVATNGPGSGIRYKEKQADGSYIDKLITFDSPDINLPTNLEIKKDGLKEGESARFRIQRRPVNNSAATWEDYSTVFVTKKKTNTGFSKDATVKIIGLHPDYVYRIIEEEGWSWSYGGTTVTGLKYDPDTGEQTTVTNMTNGTAAQNWNDNTVTSDKVNLNPITFTNKKKDVQVRYAESIVINEFKNATEAAQAGHTENSKEQPK